MKGGIEESGSGMGRGEVSGVNRWGEEWCRGCAALASAWLLVWVKMWYRQLDRISSTKALSYARSLLYNIVWYSHAYISS